jgi:hypothetical protein
MEKYSYNQCVHFWVVLNVQIINHVLIAKEGIIWILKNLVQVNSYYY